MHGPQHHHERRRRPHAERQHSSPRGQAGESTEPPPHSGRQFIASLQNHDHVGNWAAGQRLSTGASDGRLAIGAAILLTSAFTPMLFMGEEWAAESPWYFFTDFQDAETARAAQEGRVAQFESLWSATPPDPHDPETYRASVLDWSEVNAARHAALLEWHRRLIQLRRTHPDLRDPDLRSVWVKVQPYLQPYVLGRLRIRRGRFDVLVNTHLQDETFHVPGGARVELSWPEGLTCSAGAHDGERPPGDSLWAVTLPQDAVAIVSHVSPASEHRRGHSIA